MHRFVNNGEECVYRGKDKSQVPGYSNWFNKVYDQDTSVYTYKLMEDLVADLVLASVAEH